MLKRITLFLVALGLLGCGKAAHDANDLAPAKIVRGDSRDTYPPLSTPENSTSTRALPTRTSGILGVYFSLVSQSAAQNKNNPDNIAKQCASVLDTARSTLDICVFEIDNSVIIDAIVRAKRRGVRVRVVTEKDYINESGPTTFAAEGIPVLPDTRDDLMHNKFVVIDNQAVWTGSFNFTENCAYKNNNNGIWIADKKLAENYSEKFRWFWEDKKFGPKPNKRDYIPYPTIKLADGTRVENYFSPHDEVDKHVIETIRRAKRSINFMAFSFTHAEIAKAMIERAKGGVMVTGVFETRQNSNGHSQYDALSRQPNVNVMLDGNPYNLHHKVIIIDDQIVITGSYNFSASATHGNDENLLIIENSEVAGLYTDEFRRVLRVANGTVARTSDANLR